MTSTDLARRETDSWVDIVGPVGALSEKIARTPFVPKAMQGNPAAAAAAILTGREMGLGPMTSLRGIDVIEGKPSLTDELLTARILTAGHTIEWRAISDERVTVYIRRRDGLTEAEITWTMRDAQRAGLAGKSNWQKYPRAMLRARALGECSHLVCPDVSLGLDVVSSIEAVAGAPSVADVPPTVVQVVQQPPAAEVELVEAVADPLVTQSQIRKIGALIGQIETGRGSKLDRAERRRLIADMAGIDPDSLESANQLTQSQASAAIDALTAEVESQPIDADIVEDGAES